MGMESFGPIAKSPQEPENTLAVVSLESAEQLKENELILPEGDIDRAEPILTENGIPHEVRQYTERKTVNEQSWIPAEFVLKIKNSQGKDEEFERVKEVFDLLKQNDIVVRYGFNPEKS